MDSDWRKTELTSTIFPKRQSAKKSLPSGRRASIYETLPMNVRFLVRLVFSRARSPCSDRSADVTKMWEQKSDKRREKTVRNSCWNEQLLPHLCVHSGCEWQEDSVSNRPLDLLQRFSLQLHTNSPPLFVNIYTWMAWKVIGVYERENEYKRKTKSVEKKRERNRTPIESCPTREKETNRESRAAAQEVPSRSNGYQRMRARRHSTRSRFTRPVSLVSLNEENAIRFAEMQYIALQDAHHTSYDSLSQSTFFYLDHLTCWSSTKTTEMKRLIDFDLLEVTNV